MDTGGRRTNSGKFKPAGREHAWRDGTGTATGDKRRRGAGVVHSSFRLLRSHGDA